MTRILILDEGFMSGAHTARGLAAAGHDVAVLAATGGRGRCATAGVHWRLAPTIDNTSASSARSRTAASTPTSFTRYFEPLRALSWNLPPPLASRLFPAAPSPARRILYDDKRAMSDHLRVSACRFPPAATLAITRRSGYPCVIKGLARPRRIGDAHRPRAGGGASARSPATATDRCFAQEYVDGATYIVGGLFERGRPLRVHVGRKVAQYPPLVGPASRLETVDEPALLAVGARRFAALELTGLASVDFIRRRNGTFAFLEVNPRPWGSISAARRRRRRSLHAARRAAPRWTPARRSALWCRRRVVRVSALSGVARRVAASGVARALGVA